MIRLFKKGQMVNAGKKWMESDKYLKKQTCFFLIRNSKTCKGIVCYRKIGRNGFEVAKQAEYNLLLQPLCHP